MKRLFLTAIIALMLVGTPYADCAWVRWSREFNLSHGKPTGTESWKRGDIFQSYQACMKSMEAQFRTLKPVMTNANMYGFHTDNNNGGYFTKYSEADVRSYMMQCVTPNINPND